MALCLHAHALTTVVWLRSPTAAPQLPRLQVLADSFAAMNVSDALWEKYYDEVVRLRRADDITAEDFHLLRYSVEARRELVAATYRDPDVFTEGTVPQVLERARAALRAELEATLNTERAEHQRQLKQVTTETERLRREAVHAVEAERRARELAEQDAPNQAQAAADERERRTRAAARLGETVGRAVSAILFLLSVVVLAVGVWGASNAFLPRTWREHLPPLLLLAVGVVAVASVANLVLGTSVAQVTTAVHHAVATRVMHWQIRQGDDDSQGPQ